MNNPATTLWAFIGAILGIYGAIIFSMGVYYWKFQPANTSLAFLQPSIWWGLVMLLSSALFYFLVIRSKSELELEEIQSEE